MTRPHAWPSWVVTLDDLERYADTNGLDYFELLANAGSATDVARIARNSGVHPSALVPDPAPGHVIAVTTIGAGTGNTYYRLECSCGWTHEDYSAMNAYDRATQHEVTAQQ